jgi:thymidylate synthase ThyX
MIERIMKEPARPVHWGKNQKGMQADQELDLDTKLAASLIWNDAMFDAIKHAEKLLDLGVHKQIANRLLEPFAHMTTIITATEWANFFNLRAHKDAQPEFQVLAFKMLEAYVGSTPRELEPGQWHLPFADKYVPEGLDVLSLLKIVAARCARISYLNFEGDLDHDKDYVLHDDLKDNGHMSPFEHALQAAEDATSRSGNVLGYIQYRKLIPNEERVAFDPEALLLQRKQHGE